MQRHMMKSKIHRATVTEADLNYEGSLTVDQELLDAANMVPYEMVKVFNVNTGDRFETYVISGPRHSGQICLNGAAARKGAVGDLLIIVTTCNLEEAELAKHKPIAVLVDEHNRIKAVHTDNTEPLRLAR